MMRIVRFFSLERVLLAVVLMGTFGMFSGCGEEDKNAAAPAPPQSQAEQDAERAAREKAMQKK